MQDNSLEEEAQRHSVLFQMVSTLAFKSMKAQMTKDGDEIDPKELHFIGKMLKDIMSSSGIREKLSADERERIAEVAKAEQARELTENLDAAVHAGDINIEAAKAAKIAMGWAV